MAEGELEGAAPEFEKIEIFVRTEMEKNQNLTIGEQY
jgi:hypothetical protein